MADAISIALDAGVDMSMVPNDFTFLDVLADMVANGTVPESRLDQSVARILQLKVDMGLFEQPATPPELINRPAWQQKDVDLALTISRESMTLLSNSPASGTAGKPVLPLSGWLQPAARILVVGPAGVDITALCGGWSLTTLATGNGKCAYPQSKGGSLGLGVSTLAAEFGVANVTVLQGVNFTSSNAAALAAAAVAAASADVVILALGEAPEKETAGDIQDLTMSAPQFALFSAVAAAGKPIVTVLIEPRPRVLASGSVDIAGGSAAILMAYLPCFTGGQAIAEVLFGRINPSGKLPFTYPRSTGDVDVHFHKPWNGSAWEGVPDTTYHDPLFPFGSGLSFSKLSYSNLMVQPSVVAAGETVTVSVTITNDGPMNASEAVLVFVRQLFRPAITPESSSLVGFTKINVTYGESVTAQVQLNTTEALAYWTPSLQLQVDAGVFNITVGGLTQQLTLSSGAQAVYHGPGAWTFERPGISHARMHSGLEALEQRIVDAGLLDAGPVPQSMREARLRFILREWADSEPDFVE